MDMNSYLIFAGLITVITGLIRVVERILDNTILRKNNNRMFNKTSSFTNNPIDFHLLESNVNNIIDILKQKDENGVPLCYFPRTVSKLQEKQLEKLDSIISLLEQK